MLNGSFWFQNIAIYIKQELGNIFSMVDPKCEALTIEWLYGKTTKFRILFSMLLEYSVYESASGVSTILCLFWGFIGKQFQSIAKVMKINTSNCKWIDLEANRLCLETLLLIHQKQFTAYQFLYVRTIAILIRTPV